MIRGVSTVYPKQFIRMKTDKRFAVISGGSRGIGRSLAMVLARDGYDLAVCSRSEEKLAALVEEIEELYPQSKVHTFSCDVSRRKDLDSFAELVRSWTDRLDVLINNAGIFMMGKLLEEEEGQLEKMMLTNLYSAYHLSRALIPMMQQRKSGDVVNICSVASLKAYPGGGSYGISKHALLGFSRNLRIELKDQGIKVCSVMPGAVLTDSWSGANLPEERFIDVEDLAEVIGATLRMSPRSVVEDIVIRPQPGDL